MAYVRRRGSQVAIVRGRRNPSSGKVEQEILFAIYSQAEAKEVIGKGFGRFKAMMQAAHPKVRFDWTSVRKKIEARFEDLPEEYGDPAADRGTEFRRAMGAFVKALLLTDPSVSPIDRQVVCENSAALDYVADLIRRRHEDAERERAPKSGKDAAPWRFVIRGQEVPLETDEYMGDLYERGDLERTAVVARLLVENFDGYAEGHNYLGLVALERGKLTEAADHFRRTMAVSRGLFPRRMGKAGYWSRLETRTYVRGLSNLALTLVAAGKHEEALGVCDRLEHEIGDGTRASSYRAAIHINSGRWAEAAAAAESIRKGHPSESFVSAIARWEFGEKKTAVVSLLHAAFNHPLAALRLSGLAVKEPKTTVDADDFNTSIELQRLIGPYLSRRGDACRRFFRPVLEQPPIRLMVDEVIARRGRWFGSGGVKDRRDFDRLHEMEQIQFAERVAVEVI